MKLRGFARYALKEKLGEGGSAEVYRCELMGRNGEVKTAAAKIFKKPNNEEIEKEYLVQSQLKSKHAVKALGIAKFEGRQGLVLEYSHSDNLKNVNSYFGDLSDGKFAAQVAHQMLDALEELHRLHFIHCDVSTKNILLTEQEIKLCDFGAALKINDLLKNTFVFRASPEYISPEIWSGKVPTKKSDFFSLAMVVFELLEGKNPLAGLTLLKTRLELNRFLAQKVWRHRYPMWTKFFDLAFEEREVSVRQLQEAIDPAFNMRLSDQKDLFQDILSARNEISILGTEITQALLL